MWHGRLPRVQSALARASLAAAAAATLLAAWWVRAPGEGYLAAVVAATVVALGLGWYATRRRTAVVAFAVAVVTFVAPARWTERELAAIDTRWEQTRAIRIAGGEGVLGEAVVRATTELRAIAARALAVRDSSSTSFAEAEAILPRGDGERSLTVSHGARPIAWAGTLRVPLDSLRGTAGAIQTPFYTALYVTAERAGTRAVATELLAAAPPADALVRTIVRSVGGAEPAAFEVVPAMRLAEARVLDGAWRVVGVDGVPIIAIRATAPSRTAVRIETLAAGRMQTLPGLALMLLVTVAAAWRRAGTRDRAALGRRLIALLLPLAAIAVVPFSLLSNATRLFDPSLYFVESRFGFTGSLGALLLTGVVALLALFAVLRSGRARPPRSVAVLVVASAVAVAPPLLRALADGIRPPASGASVGLWIAWQLALFLPAAVALTAASAAGRAALGDLRGAHPLAAPLLAAAAALLGPAAWQAPARWPAWYLALWGLTLGVLVVTRRTRGLIVTAAAVAGLGAATLVWSAVTRKRVESAEQVVRTLTVPDQEIARWLERMAVQLADSAPTTAAALLRSYATSSLAPAELPALVTSWLPTARGDSAVATLVTEPVGVDSAQLRTLVASVRLSDEASFATMAGTPGVAEVLAVPHGGGRVTTVAVFSRSRLLASAVLPTLLGLRSPTSAEPPYAVSLVTRAPSDVLANRGAGGVWTREGNEIRSDWLVAGGQQRAHVEVALRPLDALAQRGALLVFLDLAVVGLLWLVPAAADGTLPRRLGVWRDTWTHSYRARLTLALFTFFVVPAAAFAIWSYRELQASDVQSRALLVRETLRTATAQVPNVDAVSLAALAERLGTPLLVFEAGVLRRASDPLLLDLAPTGLLLPRDQALGVGFGDEVVSTRTIELRQHPALFGYAAAVGGRSQRVVIAAPARADDVTVDQRRRDLGFLVLLVTAGGAVAALWLSGLAANELARPVGALRAAANAIARGEREPGLAGEPPAEFRPVFSAFRRMASDLGESRAALEAAQRRTSAVLRNVASGVLAVQRDGRVTIANPRAELLLGAALPAGESLGTVAPPEISRPVLAFLAVPDASDETATGAGVAGDEEFDVELHGRQLRARVTRFDGARPGHDRTVVLTIDDLTELARAQRVLAWGEMARQVAHEIKNPLTPIRLGMQHLRRAYVDGRGNFAEVLDRNVTRVLEEIDRLDEIARAFSRYGTAPDQRAPGAPIDAAAIVRDVVALERIGQGSVVWSVDGADAPRFAIARDDELREVLLNLLENARHANARVVTARVASSDGAVTIAVTDDGEGIPPELQSRVFEPHFSTRTSGSGLGLAISRRLIDGWGGAIRLDSEAGRGTTVTMTLRAAGDAAPDRA